MHCAMCANYSTAIGYRKNTTARTNANGCAKCVS
jgi:hypothetical protein